MNPKKSFARAAIISLEMLQALLMGLIPLDQLGTSDGSAAGIALPALGTDGEVVSDCGNKIRFVDGHPTENGDLSNQHTTIPRLHEPLVTALDTATKISYSAANVQSMAGDCSTATLNLVTKNRKSLSNKIFVLDGEFPESDVSDDVKSVIKELGGMVKSNLSKTASEYMLEIVPCATDFLFNLSLPLYFSYLDYLVVGENNKEKLGSVYEKYEGIVVTNSEKLYQLILCNIEASQLSTYSQDEFALPQKKKNALSDLLTWMGIIFIETAKMMIVISNRGIQFKSTQTVLWSSQNLFLMMVDSFVSSLY